VRWYLRYSRSLRDVEELRSSAVWRRITPAHSEAVGYLKKALELLKNLPDSADEASRNLTCKSPEQEENAGNAFLRVLTVLYGKSQWQSLYSAEEHRSNALDWIYSVDKSRARKQQLFEGHFGLEPRQLGSQAKVSAEAEGPMIAIIAF
jgi:hypothetical protein